MDKMAARVVFAFVFCSVSLTAVTGFDCYSCFVSKDQDNANWACRDDPSKVGVTSCPPNGNCYIYRWEDAATGEIVSFSRDCSTIRVQNRTRYSLETTKMHISSCNSHLCNNGDGAPTWRVENRIRCYLCSSDLPAEENNPCEKRPEDVSYGTELCGTKNPYCAIERKDVNGELLWLSRYCTNNPSSTTDTKVSGGQVTLTHFKSCQEDLCNAGDGVVDAYDKDKILWCYSCTGYNESSPCVSHPESDPSFLYACPPGSFCTIQRRNYKGELTHLYRRCEQNLEHVNTSIADGNFRIHYTSCESSRCNSGDGAQGHANWAQPSVFSVYGIVLIAVSRTFLA